MADRPILVTGDDFTASVQLRKGVGSAAPAPFVISGSAVIMARIVSIDHTQVYTPEIAISLAAPGTVLATSLVTVTIPASSTVEQKFQGDAQIEIQVADPGKTTWWVPITIKRGNIA